VSVSPLSLQGRSRELPVNLSKSADIVVIACPGASRDNAIRRLARIADTSMMVVVAEKTQSEAARDLRDAVMAVGGRMAGFAFTGRTPLIPGFMQRWT
jgi:Mrp family chromosome partitioning ATPase